MYQHSKPQEHSLETKLKKCYLEYVFDLEACSFKHCPVKVKHYLKMFFISLTLKGYYHKMLTLIFVLRGPCLSPI